MKKIELYFVKFKEDSTMKNKNYPLNCKIESEICKLIIVILHDKCIFLANNGIQKTWTWVSKTFL